MKKIDRKYINIAIYVLVAYIATKTLVSLTSLSGHYGAGYGVLSTMAYVISLGLIFLFGNLLKSAEENEVKKQVIWSVILGVLFNLTFVLGYELQYAGHTDPGLTGKALVILKSVFLLPFSAPLLMLVLQKAEKFDFIAVAKKGEINSKKIFFISWIVIFLAYIPAFLAYYPMILSYDFHAQVLMAEGGFPDYWMHHPYLSTMMISAFYHIGKAIDNISLGMALMGLVHMIASSAVFAYISTLVSRLIPKKWVPYIVTAFLAFLPTMPVMVLCTTKDVIFSDLFALFVCLLVERFFFEKKSYILFDVLIVLTGIMSCMWRNNMVYAVVVTGILVFVFVKKNYKLLILLLTILIFLGNKGGIAFLRDVVIHDEHKNNSIEMLSVVAQAYGRTVTYNRGSLPEDVEDTIAGYLPKSSWDEYYPAISDPMKNSFVETYADAFEGKMGKALSDWFKIGLKYPDQYIDSFLDTTRGFWFIDDTSFADVLGSGLEGNMGIIYTYYSSESWAVKEIPHQPILPGVHLFYEKLISRNDVLGWPVLNLLFKPAFYTLLNLFIACLFIYKKEWKKLGLISFIVLYIGTMFLGPVVQYRYVFPWILTSLIMVALIFVKDTDSGAEK